MEKLKASTTLIVIGIALLALGAIYPLVTLVVDTTPPVVGTTVPSNGAVYQRVDKLTVYCYDTESGIASVTTVIDSIPCTLSYISKEPQSPYEIWQFTPSTPITLPKTYSFTTTVKNKADLTTTVSGTFTIYTQFQGNWYINDQQITNTSQTIYSSTATVSFKFQKTVGVDDSYISCWVEEGGTKILTLTLTDITNHIWTGTYTFTPGTHNLAIKANDGTTTITYSIVSLTIPGAFVWVMTTQQALTLAGVLSIVAGAALRVKKK
jgi:hypothetical protein